MLKPHNLVYNNYLLFSYCPLYGTFNHVCYHLLKTPDYQKWLTEQTLKSRAQIAQRLSKIESSGHFGVYKSLGESIWELKWANGRRVYFAFVPEKRILLLLGGNKNGQEKDIAKAKRLFNHFKEKV